MLIESNKTSVSPLLVDSSKPYQQEANSRVEKGLPNIYTAGHDKHAAFFLVHCYTSSTFSTSNSQCDANASARIRHTSLSSLLARSCG